MLSTKEKRQEIYNLIDAGFTLIDKEMIKPSDHGMYMMFKSMNIKTKEDFCESGITPDFLWKNSEGLTPQRAARVFLFITDRYYRYRPKNKGLSDRDIEIFDMHNYGQSNADIAKKFNLSKSRIPQIIKKVSLHKDLNSDFVLIQQ